MDNNCPAYLQWTVEISHLPWLFGISSKTAEIYYQIFIQENKQINWDNKYNTNINAKPLY